MKFKLHNNSIIDVDDNTMEFIENDDNGTLLILSGYRCTEMPNVYQAALEKVLDEHGYKLKNDCGMHIITNGTKRYKHEAWNSNLTFELAANYGLTFIRLP